MPQLKDPGSIAEDVVILIVGDSGGGKSYANRISPGAHCPIHTQEDNPVPGSRGRSLLQGLVAPVYRRDWSG
ncbi:hypothetical protein FA13DRAFT_1743183 [Coprinellus micaceus]|uniref:Uncharacterized protein n=1 Tax=Coprinellus micaceus TaxID=71717 RepID=A0A4Y7SFC0_COPMI|nr:hypothetical protein FA13DRAFT_1743183 [Coprinellus micaceus]